MTGLDFTTFHGGKAELFPIYDILHCISNFILPIFTHHLS
jgi:hypothetical protein